MVGGMRAAAVAVTLSLLASGTSHAWVSGPQAEPPVVVASGAPPRSERTVMPARTVPAGWQGTLDRDTGVVTQLWGSFVAVPGAVGDPAIAEQAARAFIAAHLAELAPGATAADFVLAANQLDGGLRTVAFDQTWRGLRVVGGSVHVVFGADRLFVAGSTALPNVSAVITPRGRVHTLRAEAWITADTRTPVVTRAIGDRVILPIVRGPQQMTFEAADHLDVEAVGVAGRWDVYVAADGAPLLRATRIRYATGTLTYDAGVRRPTGARQDYAAALTDITVDAMPTQTASDGAFAWTGTGNASVVTGLTGSLVRVVNQAGALASATLSAQPTGTVRWSLATDEFGDAQVAAFIHASIGKAKARALVPSLASWLDSSLGVYVNEAGSCNALSTGDDLHFYRKSAACENTARLADVVYHELGHSVHLNAIVPGAGAYNGSLSEGLADYFAASITEDPGIGRGFTFDDEPVRELDPAGFERVWPTDRGTTPHQTGLIISNALWDLRKGLIQKLGATAGAARADALFVGVMQRAPDVTAAYVAALTADDDDGNLGNGTPNSCAIELAFGKHGLATSTFTTTRVGTPIVDGLTITVPVTVPVGTACPPPQVTEMQIAWHVGASAPAIVELARTGTSWTGSIPAQPDHTVVNYTVMAFLDDDSSVARPQNIADPEYQLFTGTTAEIWCERFDAAPAWTSTGDNVWEWAPPGRFPASGDPLVAYSGTHVFGTDLEGDGRYGNATMTSITTPAIDVSSYDRVRLQFRRWLVVEDGTYDRATIVVNGTPVWMNASDNGVLEHVDREWRFHDLDVTPQAGTGAIQIAWEIASDTSRELGGWTLDDVCLVGTGKRAVCGDGILDEGELCDGGNLEESDGCTDACTPETETGCCSTGTGPGGPLLLAAGLLALLRRRRR